MDAPERIWLDRFWTEETTGGYFRCTRHRMNTGAGGDIEYMRVVDPPPAPQPSPEVCWALARFRAARDDLRARLASPDGQGIREAGREEWEAEQDLLVLLRTEGAG